MNQHVRPRSSTRREERRDSFEVVVVGGGIAGVSAAYFLAEAGFEGVLLVEREFLGSGATALSSGGVRQQFSTALEVELSVRALEFWRGAEQRFGVPCPFVETGYLFVTGRRGIFDRLRDAAALQQQMGAGPVSLLNAADLREVVPWLSSVGLVGGCWTPRDGRMVPADGVAALARGARETGVEIRQGWPVTGVHRRPGGFVIEGPETVETRTLVIAAGIRTPSLLGQLGHRVDIRPWLIHYAYTEPTLAGQRVPTTIDLDLGMTVKREGPGLSVGILDEATPATWTVQEMLEAFHAAASVRAPLLTSLGILKTTTGVADLSIDGHPYAGQIDDGLWVLAGFGGHGTMHGPIVAEMLARAIAGDAVSRERLSLFDPRRDSDTPVGEWMVASRKR